MKVHSFLFIELHSLGRIPLYIRNRLFKESIILLCIYYVFHQLSGIFPILMALLNVILDRSTSKKITTNKITLIFSKNFLNHKFSKS